MFSQYSWGDFIKLVFALSIPYYGYILIRYYREDIREWWINRRGQKMPRPAAEQVNGDDTPPLFAVNTYGRQTADLPVKETSDEPRLVEVYAEPQLEGPTITDEQPSAFSLPLRGEIVNEAEQSLAEWTEAANRLTKDQAGVLVAEETDDVVAKRLAAVVNNQHGRTAFADISFTR
jgi:hypothetical protein